VAKWLDPQGFAEAVLDCGKLLKTETPCGAFGRGSGITWVRWVGARTGSLLSKNRKAARQGGFSFSTL